jgi:hypothetical protein
VETTALGLSWLRQRQAQVGALCFP